MGFTAKVLFAIGALFGFGATVRLLVPESKTYDGYETAGMLLTSALFIAVGYYVRGRAARTHISPAADASTPPKAGVKIPFWAVLALLVTGMGSSMTNHGAVGFLIGFAMFGAAFWAIETAARFIWRKLRSDPRNAP